MGDCRGTSGVSSASGREWPSAQARFATALHLPCSHRSTHISPLDPLSTSVPDVPTMTASPPVDPNHVPSQNPVGTFRGHCPPFEAHRAGIIDHCISIQLAILVRDLMILLGPEKRATFRFLLRASEAEATDHCLTALFLRLELAELIRERRTRRE